MPKIVSNKKYTLKEILQERLIPNVNAYSTLYCLLTHPVDNTMKIGVMKTRKKEPNKVRVPNEETTQIGIKPIVVKQPWNKVVRKFYVEGKELRKFFEINKIECL